MTCPLITMTAITGKPGREEIFSYMKSMSDNAIGGVMIYPRSGCELEYLSEEWFFAVEGFLEAAKELGMDIWLYDDFNWPSGDAGGRITVHEKHRLASNTVEGENAGRISYATVNNGSLSVRNILQIFCRMRQRIDLLSSRLISIISALRNPLVAR